MSELLKAQGCIWKMFSLHMPEQNSTAQSLGQFWSWWGSQIYKLQTGLMQAEHLAFDRHILN